MGRMHRWVLLLLLMLINSDCCTPYSNHSFVPTLSRLSNVPLFLLAARVRA